MPKLLNKQLYYKTLSQTKKFFFVIDSLDTGGILSSSKVLNTRFAVRGFTKREVRLHALYMFFCTQFNGT